MLFKALVLTGFVVSAGGVAFGLAVLWPLRARIPPSMPRRSLALIAAGAGAVLVFEVALLLVEPWALADELGRWPVAEFLATGFAHAGPALGSARRRRRCASRWTSPPAQIAAPTWWTTVVVASAAAPSRRLAP